MRPALTQVGGVGGVEVQVAHALNELVYIPSVCSNSTFGSVGMQAGVALPLTHH